MIDTERKLISFLKRYNKKKVFILSGQNSYFKNKIDRLFDKSLPNKHLFIKQNKIPLFTELKKIVKSLNNFDPDLIIAFGGGSAIDYAKIANVVSDLSKIKEIVIDQKQKLKKKCKLLAIPTTAGSGAEVTPSAVIYYKGRKYSLEGSEILPDFYFLIPKYIKLLNKKVKASSGFDAIAQSIESIFSVRSNKKSLNFSTESLKISFKNFIGFVKKPNKSNISNMLVAANLSGKAIAISKTTAPHAFSYPFTSLFNIDHGHAVSLTLGNVLRYNYENIKKAKKNFNLQKRYALLFRLTKTKSIEELISFINILKKKTNLHNNLTKFNINIKKDYFKIMSGINLRRLSNNPVTLDKKIIKKILFEIQK